MSGGDPPKRGARRRGARARHERDRPGSASTSPPPDLNAPDLSAHDDEPDVEAHGRTCTRPTSPHRPDGAGPRRNMRLREARAGCTAARAFSWTGSSRVSARSRRSRNSRRAPLVLERADRRCETCDDGELAGTRLEEALRLAGVEQQVDGDRGLVGEQSQEVHLLEAEVGALGPVEHFQHAQRALLVRSGAPSGRSARSPCPPRRRPRTAGRS